MAAADNYINVSRRPPDVEDYIDMLRRYRSWIIGPTFGGLVIAVVVAFLWPDTFISTALMRITPQQVPERLVPSAINSQMAERLTAMQQEILSRTSLTELIQRPALNLYPRDRQRLPLEDVLEQMRKDVSISMLDVATQGANRGLASAFVIRFKYTDKYKAQAVVRELVSKFSEQNVTVQRNQATLTTSFLNDEWKTAKENLDRLDGELARFKSANQGRLPEQFQANVASLNSMQQQLGAMNESLNRNQQEKMLLETQLQNLKTQLGYFSSAAAETSGNQAVQNERLINLNKMILDAKAALAAALEIYTEDYPEIKNFRARLATLEKERDNLEKQDQAKQQQAASTPPPQKDMNPQVAKSIEDTKSAMALLQTQIQGKNSDIEERVRQQAGIAKAIAQYQARIEASPLSEQKYAALQREYQIAKDNFDDKAKRRQISETSQNLEERKAGENLEVLDPASLPEQPAEPNRLAIAGIGAAAGLFLGIVLAGAKEMKNTSLKNLKDVRVYTNLPVLSSIPLLENALLVRRKRRLFWLAWSSAIVIGSIAMSGSMFYYFSSRT
jgi:polysaccharide chain length determinant protein (PEP-CTERM system associated)